MKEDNKNIDYLELSSKYLSGNATDAEVQQLETWVLAAPSNKKEFLALRQAWLKANTKVVDKAINVNEEWKAVEQQISASAKMVALKPKRRGLFLKIAAAVAVLVVASLWLFQSGGGENKLTVFSESRLKEQKLNDGSQIALNQFSTASYSVGADGSRQVQLKGDAFFDVARDTSRPFVINTQDVNITVLGTSFYVDSRHQQDNIQVIVSSGTVAMEVGGQKVILTKGEVGTYVKSSQQLSENTNDDPNFLAWKTKRLVYENERLEKVVYDLNRTFHANVSLANSDLNNCPITATYQDKSLDAILRIIEKTLTLKATTNGQQTVISGTCN